MINCVDAEVHAVFGVKQLLVQLGRLFRQINWTRFSTGFSTCFLFIILL